jgi:DsbC/DsbD-like thiol-disulfide interchange protein
MKQNITTIKLLIFIVFSAAILTFAQQVSLVEAKLVADSFSPHKDSVISIGVLINLKDDWHIYWRNPGDSGLPTDIEFILPNEIVASEIKFPIPEIFSSDEIVNYGYSHQVLLISKISIPKDFKQKEISISAKLSSLICKDLCKVFDTTLTLKISLLENYSAEKSISNLFTKTRNLLPVKDHNIKISANNNLDLILLLVDKSFSSENEIKSFEFYPYQTGVFKNKVKHSNNDLEKYLELVLEPDQFRVEEPKEVKGIIILNDDNTKAYEINIPIKD